MSVEDKDARIAQLEAELVASGAQLINLETDLATKAAQLIGLEAEPPHDGRSARGPNWSLPPKDHVANRRRPRPTGR